jgi:hypothetical protein
MKKHAVSLVIGAIAIVASQSWAFSPASFPDINVYNGFNDAYAYGQYDGTVFTCGNLPFSGPNLGLPFLTLTTSDTDPGATDLGYAAVSASIDSKGHLVAPGSLSIIGLDSGNNLFATITGFEFDGQ